MTQHQLTFLSEALPVKPSPLPEDDADSMTTEEISRYDFWTWWATYAPVGSSGKMSPASCQLTKDGRLEPSSQKWQNMGMGGPTESWTLSTSECPNDAVESSLSDILEESGSVAPKYSLSPKACQGILRRAKRRKKPLPVALEKALKHTATGR